MSESLPLLSELWKFGATILVLAMQAGFLLLEAGSVRSKNSVNVAQKNVTDMALCWVIFLAFGFTLAFGLPSPLMGDASESPILSFLFQLGFCSAAATIVAGAVAERMSFAAYAWVTLLVAGLLYPLTAWSVWGNLLVTDRPAWLADFGFVDFAGATVVHLLSATVALAAIIQLGPRIGRFNEDGTSVRIAGHSPVLSMLGVTILLIGWFGFNAGGLSPGDPWFKQTILNTATAACFGGIAAMFFARFVDAGVFMPHRTINGMIGGLVVITASGGYPTTLAAAGLGILGGLVAVIGSDYLLNKRKLDDPLDVVAVHGLTGTLGTLLVAGFIPTSQLVDGGRFAQFLVQLFGICAVVVPVFATSWVGLRLIDRFVGLRVSADDEFIGLNYTEHGVSIDTQRLKRALDSKVASGEFANSVTLSPEIIDDAGELAQSMNALLERHEEARNTISAQAHRFHHFASTTSDYLWETNAQLELTHISAGSEDLLDKVIELAQSQQFFDVFSCSHRDRTDNQRRIARQEPMLQFRSEMHDGKAQNTRVLDINGVPYFDEKDNLLGYRGGATDITEQQLAEKRANYLALHDELTGLGNRRALDHSLNELIGRSGEKDMNVVIAGIDLDGFKEVNDAYGHAVGDSLLQAVAERFLSILRSNDKRSSDKVYRTGGDEFLALLSDFNVEDRRENAVGWCTRIIEQLEQPFQIEERTIAISASIGLSFFPDDTRSKLDLLRMADIAMYQAKVNGKGQVIPFDVSMDRDAQQRRDLESSLHEAFEQRQLFLTYQPKVDVKTGEVLAFEALVRWNHPERGLLTPDKFLPAIERLKMMPELGDYVLHEACAFAASWNKPKVVMAVNISPLHLVHPEFIACLDSALSNSELDPRQLEIEITEETLITDYEHTQLVLEQIQERNVSIAVDDFGRGSTSLRYLQQFPLNTLKIDRSFVSNIASDPRAREIARSVVRLGHDLGLRVTAEGVEEQAQLSRLMEWDCDEAQGFLFSRPVERSEAEAILRDGITIDNPNYARSTIKRANSSS